MPPIPPTTFPDGSLARLWDAVLAKLRADPVLRRGVKTWQTWEGDGDDNRPLALKDLPMIRLTLQPGAFQWADECRFDGPLTLGVEMAVPSRRQREILNFWQAIAKALSPSNQWMDILIPLGCYNVTMTVPAIKPELVCEGQALAAEGQITLKVNVGI